jgi:uncharacterized BrkB/YihY/UPF0761 family membrane protein
MLWENKQIHSSGKGQYTIVALIATFMIIVAFAAIYPILYATIQSVLPQMDAYTQTLMLLIPFFIVLAIIMTIIYLVIPHTEG